ncbi:MAG: hypothetical protein NT176_18150, partial [Proteobacteria bacterium]|nr:hypothetical protein [Pseudomonadota bacterium]
MPDDLLDRLRRFHDDAFPQYRAQFRTLVDDGQRPTTLFIGCSDSRLVPYLLTGYSFECCLAWIRFQSREGGSGATFILTPSG